MESADEIGAAAYRALELNFRHKIQGMFLLLEDGRLDVFDCLGVAPMLMKDADAELERTEYERRRLAYLDAYRIDWARMKREDAESGLCLT